FFSVNPNSHFVPTKTLVLNPKAWTDAPPGTFGVSAPYYINNRWQRQPAESLSVGRNFRVKEKYNFQIRAEFQNPFNRVFYSVPVSGYPSGAYTPAAYQNPFPVLGSTGGALSGGYGFVNEFNGGGTNSSAAVGLATGLNTLQPRTGQIVARFTF
ncbi:MAG: hypothetical protein ACLPWF_09730, partial [Bryobacteraceae bacterium]